MAFGQIKRGAARTGQVQAEAVDGAREGERVVNAILFIFYNIFMAVTDTKTLPTSQHRKLLGIKVNTVFQVTTKNCSV